MNEFVARKGIISVGDILPKTDNLFNLGSSGLTWNTLYVNNISSNGSLTLSGFTQGSVLFAGAGGVVSEDSSFIWNESTNRLGIRVASPLDAVHLSGNLRIEQSQPATNSNINNIFFVNSNITTAPLASISFNTESFSSSTNLVFSTASTGILNEVFRITSNRNFLLGTTSNLARLTTVGNGATSATWTAQFHNSTGTSNTLMLRDDGAVLVKSNAPYAISNPAFHVTGVLDFYSGGATGSAYYLTGNSSASYNILFGDTTNRWRLTKGTTATPDLSIVSISGLNTIDYKYNGGFVHSTTKTATQNNDYGWNFTGTLTARAGNPDTLNGVLINPTLVAAANNQVLAGATISPIFSNGSNPGTINSIRGVDVSINTVSGVTRAIGYGSNIIVGSGSNVSIISHFFASSFGSVLGTANTQIGFNVGANLIGAAINYGFFGEIPDGNNRWNIFMSGTAPNYLAGNLSVGTTGLNARVSIRGNSATTGNVMLVQNFDGITAQDLFIINNNPAGNFQIGNDTVLLRALNNNVRRVVAFYGGNTAGGVSIEDNNASVTNVGTAGYGIRLGNAFSWNPVNGTHDLVRISPNQFNPTSGNAIFNFLGVSGIINQTGGASGVIRGIYVSPTLTAAFDYRAIETNNNTGWQIYAGGSAASFFRGALSLEQASSGANQIVFRDNTPANRHSIYQSGANLSIYSFGAATDIIYITGSNGNVAIGNGNTNASARLHVRGSSSVSGNALLVENSTPSPILTITNDGRLFLGLTGQQMAIRITNGQSITPDLINPRCMYFTNGLISGQGVGFAFGNIVSRTPTLNWSGGQNALVHLIETFSPTTANAEYAGLWINNTINQTGTASGITRSISIDPVLTSAARHLALDARRGHISLPTSSTTSDVDLTTAYPTNQRMYYDFDATSGNRTLTLFTITAALVGIILEVKKIDMTSNLVNLVTSGGQLIDNLYSRINLSEFNQNIRLVAMSSGSTFYWSTYGNKTSNNFEITGTTTNDTPLTLYTITPNSGETLFLDIDVIGYNISNRDSTVGNIKSSIKRNSSGVTSLIGTNSKFINNDSPTTDFDISLNGNNIQITVTGNNSETYDWSATIRIKRF